ncbi:hypothetical protein [Streptomyces sp. NPDC001450]
MLLSAHDAHVAYETMDPAHCPKMQGAFLREEIVPAGFGGPVGVPRLERSQGTRVPPHVFP